MRFILFLLDAPPKPIGKRQKILDGLRRGFFLLVNIAMIVLFVTLLVQILQVYGFFEFIPQEILFVATVISLARLTESITAIMTCFEKLYKPCILIYILLNLVTSFTIATYSLWQYETKMATFFARQMSKYSPQQSETSRELEAIQKSYSCCGWFAYFDYYGNHQIPTGHLPNSCCDFRGTNGNCTTDTEANFNSIHLNGCSQYLTQAYKDWYMVPTSILTIVSTILLIIAISLYKAPPFMYAVDMLTEGGFKKRLATYMDKRSRYCVNALKRLGAPLSANEKLKLKASIRNMIETEYRTYRTMNAVNRQGVSIQRVTQFGFDIFFEDAQTSTEHQKPGTYILEGHGLVFGQVKLKDVGKGKKSAKPGKSSKKREADSMKSNAALFTTVLRTRSRLSSNIFLKTDSKWTTNAPDDNRLKTDAADAILESRLQIQKAVKTDDYELMQIKSAGFRFNNKLIATIKENEAQERESKEKSKSTSADSKDSLMMDRRMLSQQEKEAASKILSKYRSTMTSGKSSMTSSPSAWMHSKIKTRVRETDVAGPVFSLKSDMSDSETSNTDSKHN